MEPLPRPLDGDRNRAPALLALFWTPFPLTVALICARIFVRLRFKNLGMDDYAMLFAWVLYTIANALISVCVVHGGARHLFYLRPEAIELAVKYNWISTPFGAMASTVGKISVGFLMLRIIGPVMVWRKWLIYSQLAIYLIITTASIIITFAQCSPSRALWEPVPGSRCWNPSISVDFTVLQSAYGTFMDFLLAIIPITIIGGLQMSIKQKCGLCILLSLGVLAGIGSAIKTAQLRSFGVRRDFTWEAYSIYAWASVEVTLVIICGCIPTLKPLFDHFFKGRPVKPLRPAYPIRPYEIHSDSKRSGKTSLLRRYDLSTNVTSNAGSDSRAGDHSGSAITLRDVRVEHGIHIAGSDGESTKDIVTRENEMV